MANYIYTNGVLQNTNELKHWKYLKKKKVNGKWRYYYSDDEYNNAKSEYESAKKFYDEGTQTLAKAKKIVDDEYKKAMSNGKISLYEQAELGYKNSVLKEINSVHIEAGKKYVSSKDKWKKVKIKTMPRRIVAKGAAAVANLFSRSKKK